MSQFYIVNVWEDHVGCANAYAVSSEDLAMEKMAELRDANRWDTIEIRGPFTVDDGNDLVGDENLIVHTDDKNQVALQALRDGDKPLQCKGLVIRCILELQRNAHRHSQSFHSVSGVRIEVHW